MMETYTIGWVRASDSSNLSGRLVASGSACGRRESMGEMSEASSRVVVYVRRGCHLCDVAKETLRQLQQEVDFQWSEVDIDSDPQLREAYNEEIPVISIDGRKRFIYGVNVSQFLEILAGREPGARPH